jgi:hypothetical protein
MQTNFLTTKICDFCGLFARAPLRPKENKITYAVKEIFVLLCKLALVGFAIYVGATLASTGPLYCALIILGTLCAFCEDKIRQSLPKGIGQLLYSNRIINPTSIPFATAIVLNPHKLIPLAAAVTGSIIIGLFIRVLRNSSLPSNQTSSRGPFVGIPRTF